MRINDMFVYYGMLQELNKRMLGGITGNETREELAKRLEDAGYTCEQVEAEVKKYWEEFRAEVKACFTPRYY